MPLSDELKSNMAAKMGLSPENPDNNPSPPDKNIEERLVPPDQLMTRLRGRVNQYKSWNDSIKALKMAVLNDKRYYSDALEKTSLQSCLDKLHKAMKIVNQQSLVERLEVIARQLGMSYTPPTATESRLFLSAEMFIVEILPDGHGGVKDVKIGHHDSSVTCEDLVEVLRKGDFDEFVTHMQGLLSIYSLHGDKKQKSKAYLALSSLESDLNVLAQLQSSISGVANYIHKSPLGILLPRRGGHAMKLIYFVSPYDLLCKKTKSSYPMTHEAITDNDLGHSVTVCLEPCATTNKLQTMPMISVKTHHQDGKSLPSFQGLNNMNSASLAASFVLVLPQPVPVSMSIINHIQMVTGLDISYGETKSLYSLILEQTSQGKLKNDTELFVTLPDQQHIYYLNDLSESCLGQPGALVTKIPFTHPTSVAKVLSFLRQQLLFNCVIQSLIRPLASHDYKTSLVFELTAMSHDHLSVMFEHPLHATMMTVELDLSDITCVKCKVCMGNGDDTVCSDEFISRAFQRCLSIPVTLRTVIQRVRSDVRKLTPPEPVTVKPNKPKFKWRSEKVNIPCTVTNTCVTLTPQLAQANVDSWAYGPHLELKKYYLPHQPSMNNKFMEPPPPSEEHIEKPSANPLLATLLDQGSPMTEQHHNPVSDSPMLSKLLEEQTPVTSNPPPAFTQPKQRKLGKRKSSKDVLSGKGPKQRPSDSDINERLISERHGQGIAEKRIDLDSSGGSFEGDQIRPPSVSSVGSIGGQSSTGSIIDLTDIGESHVKKLEYTLDNIMSKEAGMGHMNLNMSMNNNQMGGAEGMNFQMPHMMDMHHSQNPHMGDGSEFIHHPQWGSHPTPPRPTSRNSPHHSMVPKNETASTSLEGNLTGPGDGRDTQGPNLTHCRRNSGHAVRLSSYRRQSSRTSIDSNMSDLVSPDVFSPNSKSPVHHPLASPHRMVSPSHSSAHSSTVTSPVHHPTVSPSHFLSNIKSEPGAVVSTPISMTSPRHSLDSRSGITSPRHSLDSKGEITSPRHSLDSRMSPRNSLDSKSGMYPLIGLSNSIPGSFAPCSTPSPVLYSSGKPSLSALKAQLEMKNDIMNSGFMSSQEKEGFKSEERVGPPGGMKLRLNMKHINDTMKHYDNVSPPESDKSRSSMFDFHSDDEEFSLPHLEKSMTVISSSPTRLQISNKNKMVNSLKFNKTEKYKRKESKKNSTGDSSKRKRDKDESKKEKKRKKVSNNSYSKINDNAVYKSTTVTVEGVGENNLKPMPRLKITKSGVNFESATVVPIERSPQVKEETGINIKTDNQANTAAPVDKVRTGNERMETQAMEIGNIADKVEIELTSGINAENDKCVMGQIEANIDAKEISALLEENESPKNEIKINNEEDKSITVNINNTAVKNDRSSAAKIEKNASFHNHSETLENLLKEGVDITIGEKASSDSLLSSLLTKEVKKDVKEKSIEKNERIRNSSVSSEGIFDKIAAMKTENSSENENVIDLSKDNAGLVNTKKTVSKSQKLFKAQQSTSSHPKEDKKASGRTPTVKLKPVMFPSPTSAQPLTPTTNVLSNSSVAKTISASPTSTTIGKIGAVSLATSGSQKHLTQPNKSPQNSHKLPSKGSSGAILSKSAGNLQKTVQITGASGKNSPILQSGSKSGGSNANRSTSLSSLSSKSDKSLEKTARTSLSGNRTSSPLLGREKDSSKSRSSSGSRDRDRDKSTSASKTSTPATPVLKQETAASVLSFLNPKASSIAKLPPIPKKLSSTDSAKNSPTTSYVNSTTTSPVVTSSVSQTTSARTVSSGAASNPKGKNVHSKPNNLNRQLNNTVANAGNRTGNNSPVNYSTKNHSNSYSNKNNSNANNARMNSANSGSNASRVNSGQNASNVPSNRGNNNSSQNSRGNASVNNQNRGVTHNNSNNRMNSTNNVPSNAVSNRSNISGINTTYNQGNKNIASVPNAPRGPGPPASSNATTISSTHDDHSKPKQTAPQPTVRGRKSSLSAVIDKLTCKVSVPTSEANKQSKPNVERVVIDEPPASPEPETANDKVVDKGEKAKIVINESPESPEPENKNGGGSGAQRNERTKSEGSIVSIPLDKQVSRSPDITKQGNRVSGHRQSIGGQEKGKSNRPGNLSFSNSAGVKNKSSPSPTLSQSPISIPLTPKSNDSQTPLWNKPNHQVLKKQNSIENLKTPHEDTNGELVEDEDLRIILNQKPPQGYHNTPGAPGSNRSRGSTPVDLNVTRQSPNIMHDKMDKSKENKFVMPVSRALSTDKQNEDSENRVSPKKSRPNSRPILSPESPCSSPDNGLIIDVDSSPKHILCKTNSPMCNQDGIRKDFRTSPNFLKAVKSSPLSKIRPSPGTSPTSKERMSDSSSPCFLDDDLMDEALIGDGADG